MKSLSLSKLFFEKTSEKGGSIMFKENNPILSDEFLDEVVKEINVLFGPKDKSDEWNHDQESSL